jgi:HD-like signal output (HDOD) protein
MTLRPRDLLSGYVELSSLPQVHVRLEEAINNPKKSMADIAKIIRDDPGLTARLLRMVNSGFYSFPSRIETVTQAVTIVGTQQLSALALATSVMRMFRGIPGDLVNMESFWRHSVACGVAARTLATYRREPNPERYFIGGILHDIGRLVMYTRIADECREALALADTVGGLLYDAEFQVLGFTHAVVGGELLQAWKLPASLEESVMYHHNPGAAPSFPAETALVHVADIIAHSLGLGQSGERFVPPVEEDAWNELEIQTSALGLIMNQMERQYSDALTFIVGDDGHA